MGLNETSGNMTAAITGAQHKLEEVRDSHNSGTLSAQLIPPGHYVFPENYFGPALTWPVAHSVAIDIFNDGFDPDGKSNSGLYWISVAVSWAQKGGRIIGEDNGAGGGVALNGVCDGAEDVNGNGIIDSPAQIITLMAE
jgi:hypothetical protein